MQDFKKLKIWEKSVDLTEEIYKVTKIFPKEEAFGLTSQIRRAPVSICSNIAEGAGRSTNKDFLNFLHYATGSLKEVECQMIIARRLNYIVELDLLKIDSLIQILGKQIFSFMERIKFSS